MNHWDLRKGPTPVLSSVVDTSHYDPVYDVTWLQSKTGTEAVTVSTDGRLFLWDVRDMSQPAESVVLTDGVKENPKVMTLHTRCHHLRILMHYHAFQKWRYACEVVNTPVMIWFGILERVWHEIERV